MNSLSNELLLKACKAFRNTIYDASNQVECNIETKKKKSGIKNYLFNI
jgi:hypothetical protein